MLTTTDIEGCSLRPLSSLLVPESLPSSLSELGISPTELFDRLYIVRAAVSSSDSGFMGRLVVAIDSEFSLPLLGDVAKLAIGTPAGITAFEVNARIETVPPGTEFEISLVDVPIVLRLASSILRPLKPNSNEPDLTKEFVEIPLGALSVTLDSRHGLIPEFEAPAGVTLPRCVIGDTGIVVAAENLTIDFGGADPGLTFDRLQVEFPRDLVGLSLDIKDARISVQGFTGSVYVAFDIPAAAELAGFKLAMAEAGLAFESNRLTASLVKGTMALPFFDDEDPPRSPIGFSLSIAEGGRFMLALESQEPDAMVSADFGPLRLDVKKLQLEKAASSTDSYLLMSAKLSLDVENEDPISFDLNDLKVFADGRVEFPGGWFDLDDLLTYRTGGFAIEVTRIGIGLDTGQGAKNWLGITGSMRLSDEIGVGASVEGARFLWWKQAGQLKTAFEVAGVGLELLVPDAFLFRTQMVFFKRGSPSSIPGFSTADVSGVGGSVLLQIIPFSFTIDGSYLVGRHYQGDAENYRFWMAYLNVSLPTGILLGSTGASIYGFAGLLAQNMRPNKQPAEDWYRDWYKKREVGATHFTKWEPSSRAFGVGVGLTLGTAPDNGLAFSSRAMFILSLPGPVLMLAGKANLLKERRALDDPSADPLFQFLCVYDGNEESFLFALEVSYSLAKLLEIGGITEVYFSLNNPTLWHVYVGQKPDDKRLRARILQLFTANSYFMLDNRAVAFGFLIGYKPDPIKAGPIKLTFQAYIVADALISWKPELYAGRVGMVGEVALAIFGFELGLALRAMLEASGPKPWRVAGDFKVKVSLPWPLPDPEAKVYLEWVEELPPALSDPLGAVQFDEHSALCSTRTFAVYEDNADNWQSRDLVPMDGALSLIFNQQVEAQPSVGGPLDPDGHPLPVPSSSVIIGGQDGAQYEVIYTITSLQLEKVGGGPAPLVGCWARQELQGEGNIRKAVLQVNTFDVFRMDRMVDMQNWLMCDKLLYGEYFCPPAATRTPECWIASKALGNEGSYIADGYKGNGFSVRVEQGILFSDVDQLRQNDPATYTRLQELRPNTGLQGMFAGYLVKSTVIFDRLVDYFRIAGAAKGRLQLDIYAGPTLLEGRTLDFEEITSFDLTSNELLQRHHPPATHVVLCATSLYLWKICHLTHAQAVMADFSSSMAAYSRSIKESWETDDPLFDPHTVYRLSLSSQGTCTKVGGTSQHSEGPYPHEIYFKTGGAPDDLRRYVRSPVPGNDSKGFFRSYAVDVEFVSSHVPLMYIKDGNNPVFMVITAASGKPIKDTDGNDVVKLEYYPVEQTHTLTESMSRFATVTQCNGTSQPVTAISSCRTLRFSPRTAQRYLLDPETWYVAYLASNLHVQDGAHKRLYEFSFTTSRFADFRSMVMSDPDAPVVEPIDHDLLQLRDFALELLAVRLTEEQRAQVLGIFARYAPTEQIGEDVLSSPDREGEHSDHEKLREYLHLSPYQPPAATEVHELHDDVSHFGFLIQFPEPVDWRRVLLTGTLTRVERNGDVEVEYAEKAFSLVRNRDGTAAFIQFKAGEKISIQYSWVRDFIDRTPWRGIREFDRPIRLVPPGSGRPILPRPTPPGAVPLSLRHLRPGRERDAIVEPPAGTATEPSGRGFLLTLFLIFPAIARLVLAWAGLALGRLFGGRWVRTETREPLNDLTLKLLLHLDLRYTRDFSARMSPKEWVALRASHPDLFILAKQGDANTTESGQIGVEFDHGRTNYGPA